MARPAANAAKLTPLLQNLIALMGRRADDPEVVAFVTQTLGQKKVPQVTTDRGGGKNVVAKKYGIELLFGHDIKNDRYPLIQKTKTLFVPYLQLAWLKPNFPGPLPFGVTHDMAPEEITKRLGVAPGTIGTLKRQYWERVLDPNRDIVFGIAAKSITIGVAEARELSSRHHPPVPQVGVFVAWAVERGLLDESRFAAHTDLLAAVKKRAKKGSELLTAAMPRGVWDCHLKDVPGLRDFAYGWFHNIDHGYIVFDLIQVFGKRPGPHGHDEPVLDDDDWKAVDQAAKTLDKRFAKFLA